MATLDVRHVLRIKVLEDSAECGLFVINVRCGEPLLLQFWCGKPPFRNGQVEQTDVRSRAAEEVDFVLRALHRAPNLPNGHYWGPFVLSLCLDALPFRFRLPARAHGRIQDIMEEGGELRLLRYLTAAPVIQFSALKRLQTQCQLCADFFSPNCGLSRPSTPARYVRPPKDKPPQHRWPHRAHNRGQSPGCFMMGPGTP